MGKNSTLCTVLLLLVFVAASSGDEKSLRDVYNLSKKCVVLLVTFDTDGNPKSLGSGVILTSEGEIVTNLHVVRDAKTIAAKLWNGSFLPIDQVTGTAQDSDLILLKADAQDLPRAQAAPVNSIAVGDTVIAIGNPLGSSPSPDVQPRLSSSKCTGHRDQR